MKKIVAVLLLVVALASASEMGQRLTSAGWCYREARPKSAQARRGNTDGRTTWWIGYWVNAVENVCSEAPPQYITKCDTVIGDGRTCQYVMERWNNGGEPQISKLEQECLCKP